MRNCGRAFSAAGLAVVGWHFGELISRPSSTEAGLIAGGVLILIGFVMLVTAESTP